MNGPTPVKVIDIRLQREKQDLVWFIEYEPENKPGIVRLMQFRLEPHQTARIASDLVPHLVGWGPHGPNQV